MKKETFEYAEDIVSKAMMFAISAHSGQTRKGQRMPAILHSMEASVIAATLTKDLDVVAAAILHDTIEDTDVTPEQLRAMFGDKIADLVASETENKRENLPPAESWQIRKEESIAELAAADDINIKILWLSDKLSNMRSFYRLHAQSGDKMWERFNQKDPQKQEWYYRKVAEMLSELKDTFAYQEYLFLYSEVFKDQMEG